MQSTDAHGKNTPAKSAPLKLYLFGTPRIERHGKPVALHLRKGLALLAYLAVTRQSHSRDTLATLFWPEKDQQSARANLRRLLYKLGQLVGEQLLEAAAETVALSADAPLWLDVEQFQRCLAAALSPASTLPSGDAPRLARLEEAAALYTADFMAGFTLPDSPEFDDWQFFQCEELRSALALLLEEVLLAYEAEAKWEEALHYARRWLALDPLTEPRQRRLMQLYAQAGQTSAALRQYEECVRILAEELNATPDDETTALYEAIRTRRFPPADKSINAAAAVETIISPPSQPVTLLPRTALPTQTTPFVGRTQELAELLRRLRDPSCRLLTLVGPGGIGKTRLALETAQAILAPDPTSNSEQQQAAHSHFKHGSFFVPLQPVTTTSGIISAIAAVLGLHFYSGTPVEQQLFHFLRDKALLLVLDNFEHLLVGAELVVAILAAAPGVKLLVTSREALKLHEEWFHPLAGMRLPPSTHLHPNTVDPTSRLPQDIATYDSVELFIKSARRALVTFESKGELDHIARICRLVDGMPLGIELAASWLKLLSCAQIADEIERGIDILVARHQNVPVRHRSLRVVLDQTWMLLDEQEQAIFKQLSVFQGGFRMEAAEEVTGATLPLLAQLIEKALVRASSHAHDQVGYYQMHELIRQFGAEQLHLTPDEEEKARAKHCAYFLTLMHRQTANLKGKQHQEAFAQITPNLNNLRAAWAYAALRQDVPLLDSAAECLWIFADMSGTFEQAEVAFQEVVHALTGGVATPEPTADLHDERRALVGFMRAGQGYMCHRRGDAKQGRALMEEGVALLRQVQQHAKRKTAIALLYLGWLYSSWMEIGAAKQAGQESMAIFAELDDNWGKAACIELLSVIAKGAGEFAEAERLSLEGLTLTTKIEANKLRGGFLQKLGDLAIWFGAYGRAEQYLEEALEIAIPIGSLPGITQIRRDLARVAICQGHYGKAVQMLEESLALLQDGRYVLEIRVLPTLGTAYRLCGEYALAERHYEKCAEIAQAAQSQHPLVTCLMGLGALALAQGNRHRAEQLQQEALTLLLPMAMEPEMALGYSYLGELFVLSGETRQREAQHYYQQALELAVKHRLAPIALSVFTGLARILASRGGSQQAYELLMLAEQHHAATAETKQKARSLWQELSIQFSMPSPSLQNTPTEPIPSTEVALDWHLAAQKMLEELSLHFCA